MRTPAKKTRPSQSDLARACGVSRSAVSAVLLGRPSTAGASEATRRRIQTAARRLGYRPHAAAAALRSGCTHALALAVPNLKVTQVNIASQVLRGIGERAHELGYALHICFHDENGDVRASLRRALEESRVDGVFFYAHDRSRQDPRESILREFGLPYVVLENRIARGATIDFDHDSGGRQATAHLLRLGRRRIAFVGREPGIGYADRRQAGYTQALREAGLAPAPELIRDRDADFASSGSRAVREMIAAGIAFDALFCVGDAAAMTAIQALAEAGRRVPEDVAVVGYDDSPVAALASPPLTSVRQDGVAMGRRAADMLHARVGQPTASRDTCILPVSLVVRQSCGG